MQFKKNFYHDLFTQLIFENQKFLYKKIFILYLYNLGHGKYFYKIFMRSNLEK